jgi:hypothetical protein
MRAGAECGESYATCWYVDGQSSVLHRLVAERRTPVAEKPGHRDVSRGEEMKFGCSLIALFVMLVLTCGSAQGQSIGANMTPGGLLSSRSSPAGPASLGANTTPGTLLSTGSSPVGPVGIPLGSTELGTTGLSPAGPTAAPPAVVTGSRLPCLETGSASGESPPPAVLFDGGGIGSMALGGCTASGGSSASSASPSTAYGAGSPPPAGQLTAPLGSTQMSPGGLSPPPATFADPPTPLPTGGGTLACPGTGMSMPAGSC